MVYHEVLLHLVQTSCHLFLLAHDKVALEVKHLWLSSFGSQTEQFEWHIFFWWPCPKPNMRDNYCNEDFFPIEYIQHAFLAWRALTPLPLPNTYHILFFVSFDSSMDRIQREWFARPEAQDQESQAGRVFTILFQFTQAFTKCFGSYSRKGQEVWNTRSTQ